jgi:polyhydroxyalkanoate synthesis repressor PhaR
MAKAAKGSGEPGSPIIIKKYANRRLYNTQTSAYITLDDLAKMTRDGQEFQVRDAKTDEDITHTILTQIIMDEEARGSTMLPSGFLRQLISMYGDSMQAMVPGYLEGAMESFRSNQNQFKSALEGALSSSPFGELHKRNMEMFEAATSAFRPSDKAAEPKASPKDDEIAALKAQLAALQEKVEKLG